MTRPLVIACDEHLERSAAIYVRMSTDHQKFSIEHQLIQLAAYAQVKNFTIVETFIDSGKSGLTIRKRNALKALLEKVSSGNANFRNILVLDVSRWGRFQDVDESGHYEFICRCAGFQVHYTEEQFNGDITPMSSIMKAMKRVMAAEYSRELSSRVKFAKNRVAQKGFHAGGLALYGLRRAVIDERGEVTCILSTGQWKGVQAHRVVLRPGPINEVQTVQRIFRLYGEEKYSPRKIAAELNAEGVPWMPGRKWQNETIRKMLCAEKYIGCLVVNKTAQKLGKSETIKRPMSEWIVVKDAFEAIVDVSLFNKVQTRLASRKTKKYSDEEIIAGLKSLLKQKGKLSTSLISNSKVLPESVSLYRRYGSIFNVYKLIGYNPGPDVVKATTSYQTRLVILDVIHVLYHMCKATCTLVKFLNHYNRMLRINQTVLSFAVGRWSHLHRGLKQHHECWANLGLKNDISDYILFIQLDRANTKILDYYLVPSKRFKCGAVQISDPIFASYKFGSIEVIFRELSRIIHLALEAHSVADSDERLMLECRRALNGTYDREIMHNIRCIEGIESELIVANESSERKK